MTSNILRFNPTGANTLSDVDYNSSTSRSAGFVDGLAETALFNKAFYQMSSIAAALAEALSDASYTISDASYSSIVSAIKENYRNFAGVNAQTGTSYTVLTSDRNKLLTLSNASSVAVTLPQAGSTGFAYDYRTTIVNLGAGTVTITPTTSTIDGASSLSLGQNQGVDLFSDGSDYFTFRGRPAPPGLNLLSTATASNSAAIDFTSYIDSSYDEYVLNIINLVPASNGVNLWLQVSEDAGSTWKSGSSNYRWTNFTQVGGTAADLSTGDTKAQLTDGTYTIANTSNYSVNGQIRIFKPSGSTLYKVFNSQFSYLYNGTTLATNHGSSMYINSTNAINGLRIKMSSGNITSGEFKLYGVKKS